MKGVNGIVEGVSASERLDVEKEGVRADLSKKWGRERGA